MKASPQGRSLGWLTVNDFYTDQWKSIVMAWIRHPELFRSSKLQLLSPRTQIIYDSAFLWNSYCSLLVLRPVRTLTALAHAAVAVSTNIHNSRWIKKGSLGTAYLVTTKPLTKESCCLLLQETPMEYFTWKLRENLPSTWYEINVDLVNNVASKELL